MRFEERFEDATLKALVVEEGPESQGMPLQRLEGTRKAVPWRPWKEWHFAFIPVQLISDF